ncbi:MAG TPA: hypothetical protein VNO70_10130 [Blastocatellia bacterium]|nr:hypothetical protein [Blastocatellia bacterium]
MDKKRQAISLYVVAGRKGVVEAEKALRALGFDQVRPGHDGKGLHVVAPRELAERVFAASEATDRASRVPPHLRDVVAKVIFPVQPDYHD